MKQIIKHIKYWLAKKLSKFVMMNYILEEPYKLKTTTMNFIPLNCVFEVSRYSEKPDDRTIRSVIADKMAIEILDKIAIDSYELMNTICYKGTLYVGVNNETNNIQR